MNGGVVFRAGNDTYFLPASAAEKVMPLPVLARVPGAPESIVGISIVDGETLPIVSAAFPFRSPRRGPTPMLVVCHNGERIGLVGIEILATGRFEPAADGVLYEGNPALPYDVAAVFAKIRDGRWAV